MELELGPELGSTEPEHGSELLELGPELGLVGLGLRPVAAGVV
jgi:hypothetical protein